MNYYFKITIEFSLAQQKQIYNIIDNLFLLCQAKFPNQYLNRILKNILRNLKYFIIF